MTKIPPHNSFIRMIQRAVLRVEKFSESKKNTLKEKLEHGLANLSSDEEMDMYLSIYGKIHQEKLLLAFDNLPRKVLSENNISIIDYGCGQGVASMVLCDVLQSVLGHPNMISDFHLIEPSKACLERAVKFLHNFSPEAKIAYFNNECKDVWKLNIHPKSDVVVHLFSNVIDIPDFPRESVARKLNDMTAHNNIVVCVSPFYQENGRAKHMDEFGSMLRGFRCHHSFEKHTDEWDRPFSCQSKIYVSGYY